MDSSRNVGESNEERTELFANGNSSCRGALSLVPLGEDETQCC